MSKQTIMKYENALQMTFRTVIAFLLPCLSVSDYNTTIIITTDLTQYENNSLEVSEENEFFQRPPLYFHINSTECFDIYMCNSNTSRSFGPEQKRCSCDQLCGIFDDCCLDVEAVPPIQLSPDQFSCTSLSDVNIMLVTKCPANRPDDQLRTLCENSTQNDDIMSKVIVSDKTIEELAFKNMHCAMCNNVYDYIFWIPILTCPEINATTNINFNSSIRTGIDISSCKLTFDKSEEMNKTRDCSLQYGVTSHCSEVNDTDTVEKCEHGRTLLVNHYEAIERYKNKYCALCNGHDEVWLSCLQYAFDLSEGIYPTIYSFRILVDFNSKTSIREDLLGGGLNDKQSFLKCEDNQIFDPITGDCRDIICPVNTQPFEGKCIPAQPQDDIVDQKSSITFNLTSIIQCVYSKVDSQEVVYRNETNQILFRQRVYNESEYIRNGSDIFLCINTSVPYKNGHHLQASDELEGYFSFIGLIISIISLLITILIYVNFPELLNTPGKNLVSLCTSLLLAQTLFLFSPKLLSIVIACQVFAILMHYFFLAAFSWMNVIAFDLMMAFSHTICIDHRAQSQKRKFIMYSLYSWIIPLIVVCPAFIVDYVIDSDTVQEFKPRYGQVGCWISSNHALLLFFVGPLALLKLFDFIAFGFIVFYITKAKRQGARARNENNSCTFIIHLKLSLVMGLTWVFAFVANYGGNPVLWFLYIIFNTLQGLFIAISFVCTRRVFRLIKSKYSLTTSKISLRSTSTQGTSLSSNPKEIF